MPPQQTGTGTGIVHTTGTVPNWPPPPPTTVMTAIAAGSLGTVITLATRNYDVALGTALVTFGFAMIGLVAVITKYRSANAGGTAGAPTELPGQLSDSGRQ
jgi:hypothetical protein